MALNYWVPCTSDADCTAIPYFDLMLFCASNGYCHRTKSYCDSGFICGLGDGGCWKNEHCQGDLICGLFIFKDLHPLVIGANPYTHACIPATPVICKHIFVFIMFLINP